MSDLVCVHEPGLASDLQPGTHIRLGSDESHHLCRVRRVGEGREVWVISGTGPAARCTVEEPNAEGAVLRVAGVESFWREPTLRVTLAQGLVRPAEMDTVVSGATALGVHAVVPLLTERVERKGVRLDRWQRLAVESAKQCGRGWVPPILAPTTLDEVLESAERPLVVAHPEGPRSLEAARTELAASPDARLTLFVGPEGDFSDEERRALDAAGAVTWNLGERRLRSEIAAAKALSLLLP